MERRLEALAKLFSSSEGSRVSCGPKGVPRALHAESGVKSELLPT